MTCTRCGHTQKQHGNDGCRVRVLTHWNEEQGSFGGERRCLCSAFCSPVKPINPGSVNCPHEYTYEEPGCVHCGEVKPVNR